MLLGLDDRLEAGDGDAVEGAVPRVPAASAVRAPKLANRLDARRVFHARRRHLAYVRRTPHAHALALPSTQPLSRSSLSVNFSFAPPLWLTICSRPRLDRRFSKSHETKPSTARRGSAVENQPHTRHGVAATRFRGRSASRHGVAATRLRGRSTDYSLKEEDNAAKRISAPGAAEYQPARAIGQRVDEPARARALHRYHEPGARRQRLAAGGVACTGPQQGKHQPPREGLPHSPWQHRDLRVLERNTRSVYRAAVCGASVLSRGLCSSAPLRGSPRVLKDLRLQ